MTTPIFLAVLCGALLHAGWNALIKSGRDKQLDTALIHSLGFFVALPLLLWTGLPDRAAWPYIAASTVVHVGYYIALAGAYRHGDLGLTYPVMRGSAPLLVALAGFFFIGEHLSPWAWLG
ncbi:MAG: phosphonate utilization protein, partial [Variovorax sp.]|nr:phosphonate utilization protein [Variovorax sp.]